MPQRKDYDVYAGNQKVGEIWSNHPTKSDYESELNMKMMVCDTILSDLQQSAWEETDGYKSAKKKKDAKYKIRKIIGYIMMLGAFLYIAIMFFLNITDSGLLFVGVPAIMFGVGLGLRNSRPENDFSIDWWFIRVSVIGGAIGFVVLEILFLFLLAKFT